MIIVYNHINPFGYALEHSKSLSLCRVTLTNSSLVKMLRGGIQEPFYVTTVQYTVHGRLRIIIKNFSIAGPMGSA
jgi:hypothetical protein